MRRPAEPQLGRQLRLAAQQVGGLDQREQAGGLVPAGCRGVPLDVEGQPVEPTVARAGDRSLMAPILPCRRGWLRELPPGSVS